MLEDFQAVSPGHGPGRGYRIQKAKKFAVSMPPAMYEQLKKLARKPETVSRATSARQFRRVCWRGRSRKRNRRRVEFLIQREMPERGNVGDSKDRLYHGRASSAKMGVARGFYQGL